jgi:hypothetical protein
MSAVYRFPGALCRAHDPGPAFYLGLQDDNEAWIPEHDGSLSISMLCLGPASAWIPMPKRRPTDDTLKELELLGLLDIAPSETHIRLRMPNDGSGIFTANPARLGCLTAGELREFIQALDRRAIPASPLAVRRTDPGYVYVVGPDPNHGPGEVGRYKVGRAKNFKSRHRGIQAMNGHTLHAFRLWRHDYYATAESRMHTALNDYRHHGEWFDCSLRTIDAAAKGIGGMEPNEVPV